MSKNLAIAASLIAYIGTKLINAVPMTRGEYKELRGWKTPSVSDENLSEEGYLVEYPLTGNDKPNVEGFKGYVSWSPKSAFEEAYRQTDNMNFGLALEALKKGFKVARKAWESIPSLQGGSYIFLNTDLFPKDIALWIKPANFEEPIPLSGNYNLLHDDMLADDWMIFD